MANRRDIRDGFFSELETAAAQSHTVTYGDGTTETLTLTTEDVDLISPRSNESQPRVVYDDNYVSREWNGVGTAPEKVTRDSNDDVTEEERREHMTGQFTISVEGSTEVHKEPVYEAIRRQFGQYDDGGAPYTDIHSDVTGVNVMDVTSDDYGDTENPLRVDTMVVEIDYFRDYVETGDNIDSVDLEADADTDSQTAGDTYTIN